MKKVLPILAVAAIGWLAVAQQRPPKGPGQKNGQIKPRMSDAIKASVYVDNWFMMYINGKLVAVDPIDFIPHNQVNLDILPEYPMTIAILAKDNADPKTGLEYGDHIGDAGLILKFADGTVSNAKWKTKVLFTGPLDRDVQHPRVHYEPTPEHWYAMDFDDSSWGPATEYTEERVRPDGNYVAEDFTGAKFIWSGDLDLDNTVLFRYRVEKPGWKPRWNTRPDMDNTCIFFPTEPSCQASALGRKP